MTAFVTAAVAPVVGSAEAVTRASHERTKHRLSADAAGPETLDWDAQPDPFRRFAGAPLTPLPLVADALATPWRALATSGAVAAHPVHRDSLAALFELSFALTAWKQSGPDRWALRANPSSGNLHPFGHHPALAQTLRRLSCHQAIAADACVVISLLADVGLRGAWRYRELLQEAGLIGQVLYLQAEAEGCGGTGIGCCFDDAVHELLALRGAAQQVLYQFTVGRARVDERILSLPPCAGRAVVAPVSAGTGASS